MYVCVFRTNLSFPSFSLSTFSLYSPNRCQITPLYVQTRLETRKKEEDTYTLTFLRSYILSLFSRLYVILFFSIFSFFFFFLYIYFFHLYLFRWNKIHSAGSSVRDVKCRESFVQTVVELRYDAKYNICTKRDWTAFSFYLRNVSATCSFRSIRIVNCLYFGIYC